MSRRRRLVLALLALALLAAGAGCLGGGAVTEQRLNRNATYDWNTSATVTVNVDEREYHAVYDLENRSRLVFSQESELGGRQPVPIAAVKFRYPNGTVVGAQRINVTEEGERVVVALPADTGKFAYTAPAGTRSVTIPVAVEGSYEVVLPPNMRTQVPVFGSVEPGGYERRIDDRGRLHLYWNSVQAGAITLNYYLQRDLYIFGGIVALLALGAVGGVVYFRMRIRRLERERTEAGLDVEE